MSLESEMRRVCFELNWLAQGKVASYNSDGGGSPPSSRSPGKFIERDHAPGDYWWRSHALDAIDAFVKTEFEVVEQQTAGVKDNPDYRIALYTKWRKHD